ncbi:Do family serine endopeptidase [Roseimarinus sediminis]|uniref:Do family serine endopeptidase n=1 Tax=Roseimarinus sediminis TaxID=1610899 RepID=UPI003D21F83E
MRKIQNILFSVLVAVIGGFVAIYIYTNYIEKPKIVTVSEPRAVQYASLPSAPQGPDLTLAAENSVKAVVHIQTQYQSQVYQGGNPFYDFFFGDPYRQQEPRMQQASGSGVIISDDGYIVTNNHVIERSEQITIIMNDKREYKASLIGTDPSTDIALLKIDEKNLPAVRWGDSDALKLGEWVLAVGNPFNLTSTVTAGIVSAKSRGIGIISGQLPIESFIQTDAAVNPGNSGGALVNTRGELIGINTAIASRTGSYSGYSFAVPVSIVRKVVDDLKEFGEVQRALLGVSIQTVNAELAKEFDLDQIDGVFVGGLAEDGAAMEAGIKENDVIIAINNIKVSTVSELQEQISKHRPGDKVEVLIKRDNKEKLLTATLRNMKGGTGVIKSSLTVLGAELAEADRETLEKLNIENGLIVTDLLDGKLKNAGIKKGFIITHVNKRKVNSIDDIKNVIKMSRGGVLIEGIYPNGEEAYYVFGLD